MASVARFFREKYRHFISICFLDLVTKTFLTNIWKKFHCSSSPRELSRDLLLTGGKRKFAIFKVFRAYLKELLIFFHEIFMIARSYRVIKNLLINAIVETRLKVQLANIDDFWHLSSCPFQHEPRPMIFSWKLNWYMYFYPK